MKLTAEKKAAALAMRDRGDISMAQIARALAVGRTTLYDHLDLPPSTPSPANRPTTSHATADVSREASARLLA